MYSAHVYIQSDLHGSMHHVIASGKTEKGMLSELKRYTLKLTVHHAVTLNSKVYLHSLDFGQYDIKQLKDFI